MGGEREDKVSGVAKKQEKEAVVLNGVRFHESGGKVHFHVDSEKMKATVPVAIWFTAWEKLSQQPGSWTFIDQEFNTALEVITTIENGQLDANITISEVAIGDKFAKLNKFSKP